MTDEEMAEEYLTRTVCQGCRNICECDCAYAKPVRRAFLAGLKAGRPQWHNLRKDPTDLPKDEKDMLMSEQLILLTKMKGTDNLNISIGQYNFSTQEFSYPHFIGLTDVIAWCEIPTFDKE